MLIYYHLHHDFYMTLCLYPLDNCVFCGFVHLLQMCCNLDILSQQCSSNHMHTFRGSHKYTIIQKLMRLHAFILFQLYWFWHLSGTIIRGTLKTPNLSW
jgi:hypothetical protein